MSAHGGGGGSSNASSNPAGIGGPKDDWDVERLIGGKHFVRDLAGLWEGALRLAAIVEQAFRLSVQALCDGRPDLAREVRGEERAADAWEAQIEALCLKVLALHQPVASDMRRVAAVLKVSGDLERMGDLTRHIAKRVKKLAADPVSNPIPEPLEDLAHEALQRVHESLDALVQGDSALAREVIAEDREVDRLYRVAIKSLKQSIREHPESVDTWLRLINTARNLERIADHASKIAEAVIYLKDGQVVRKVATG